MTVPAFDTAPSSGESARAGAASVFLGFERMLRRGLAWCTKDALRASSVLALLSLVIFLPGVFSRPPVDRTEVYYAQSARSMIEKGNWLVPRDQNGVIIGRPVGILWLQGLSARVLGPDTHDAIWPYRLTSIVGAILAAVFLFLGLRTIIGAEAAFCACILLALTLPMAIQARLALPQSMTLAAAIVVQTSLARLYLADANTLVHSRRRIALTLWLALGVSVLLNSLIVPIVAGLTVIGLFIQDRSPKWLKGTYPVLGLLLAVLIALPWPVSVWLSIKGYIGPDNPSRSVLAWLSLLVDSQSMKHRAFPGSFLLMAWLAFLPCLLLFDSACRMVWQRRAEPAIRFLLAWLLPYLVVMELLSHKPPLYMLQYVLPALAVAIALRVANNPITGAPEPVPLRAVMLLLWVILGAFLATAPLALEIWVGEPLTPLMVIAAVAVAAGFATTAVAWRRCQPLAAITFSLAGGAVFYWLVAALILPSPSAAWPSVALDDLRDATRTCYPGSTIIAGYTEPSAVFEIGGDILLAQGSDIPRLLQSRPGSLAVVDLSEVGRLNEALRAGAEVPLEIACVRGHNLFTGRRNTLLRIYAKAPLSMDPACAIPEQFRCWAQGAAVR